MGYRESVDLALDEEIGVREGPEVPQRAQAVGPSPRQSLDEFDFAPQPELDARTVRTSPRSRLWSNAPTCSFGVGKTTIAVGLSITACQAGASVYFTTSTTW